MIRRAAYPFPVCGMQVDRCVECFGPVLHRRVIMRMGDGDCAKAAQRPDNCLRRLIEERDAIPKHVAGGCTQEKGALIDGECRYGLDCHEAGLEFEPGIAMCSCQFLPCRPGLA